MTREARRESAGPKTAVDDLRATVEKLDVAEIPAALGKLMEATAIAQQRLLSPKDARPTRVEACARLLTAAELAELWRVSEDYIARLMRQRKIPTVHLPALDRGHGETKRTPDSKLVRIPLDALIKVINDRVDIGFAPLSGVLYHLRDEGTRGTTDPKSAQCDAGRPRRSRRRPLDHGESMGARRGQHPDADGEATADADEGEDVH